LDVIDDVFICHRRQYPKYLIQDFGVIQIVWSHCFIHALILAPVFGPRLKKLLITQNLKLQPARSLLLLATTSCFFMGPIFVAALSVPLLKENVGPQR
jgi:threonine/homoserine efflux transporter RhtA